MNDHLTLVEISAFSGLAGALMTQAFTGLFAYLGDKRKSSLALQSTFRSKQIEIAGNFYYVTGEKMAVVKKNIGYWRHGDQTKSEASLDFLNKEMVKLNAYMDKLDAENWQCNLISLYFDISLSTDALIVSNDTAKKLFLKILDTSDALKHALPDSRSDIYQLYDQAISDICRHYEEVYHRMSADMATVKTGLIKAFR